MSKHGARDRGEYPIVAILAFMALLAIFFASLYTPAAISENQSLLLSHVLTDGATIFNLLNSKTSAGNQCPLAFHVSLPIPGR